MLHIFKHCFCFIDLFSLLIWSRTEQLHQKTTTFFVFGSVEAYKRMNHFIALFFVLFSFRPILLMIGMKVYQFLIYVTPKEGDENKKTLQRWGSRFFKKKFTCQIVTCETSWSFLLFWNKGYYISLRRNWLTRFLIRHSLRFIFLVDKNVWRSHLATKNNSLSVELIFASRRCWSSLLPRFLTSPRWLRNE